MSDSVLCADCGIEHQRRHPLSTRCRRCHLKSRRQRPGWRKVSFNRSTWAKKSRRVRSEVGHCQFCGTRDDLTVDHIVPRVLGGSSDRSNLRVLCDSCHQEHTRLFNKTTNSGA